MPFFLNDAIIVRKECEVLAVEGTPKIRILLAEDFEIIRADFRDKINSQPDMEVVGEASGGNEMIRLARDIPADIILMDMEMEDINAGVRATQAILNENPEMDIVFLTIHETEECILSAMGAGAVDYLVKTAPVEVLFSHIRNVFRGVPQLEPQLQELLRSEFLRMKRSEESLIYFVHILSTLTQSERDILRLLCLDMDISQIADTRVVEIVTVKTQIQGILRKFGCRRTREIVKMLRTLGLDRIFLRDLR